MPTAELGTRQIEGKTAKGFEIQARKIDPDVYSGPMEIWIDPDTNLPLLVRYDFKGAGYSGIAQMTSFHWNADLDPKLFDPAPPAGFTETPRAATPVDEQVSKITEGLKLYAKASGGHYPRVKMLYGDVTRDEFAKLSSAPFPPRTEADFADPRTAMVHKATWGFAYINVILRENADAAYYGKTVGPDDKDKVLLRWKLDDGTYEVIYGDLRLRGRARWAAAGPGRPVIPRRLNSDAATPGDVVGRPWRGGVRRAVLFRSSTAPALHERYPCADMPIAAKIWSRRSRYAGEFRSRGRGRSISTPPGSSPAGGSYQDAVGELDGLVDVVGDEQDRLALLLPDPHQVGAHLEPRDVVERPERLVHVDDLRVRRPGRGRSRPAAACRRTARAGRIARSRSGRPSRRSAGSRSGRARPAHPAQAEADVVADGQPGEDAALLEDEDPPRSGPSDRLPLDEHLAPRRRQEAADDVQQRGLAATRRADDADELAGSRPRG